MIRSGMILLLVCLGSLFPSAAGQLDELKWLEGTWQRETRRGPAYETWRVLSERTFEGESWRFDADGARRIGEELLLVEMGGDVFYLPKVAENPAPVPFRMSESAAGRAVFENPQHDFPQKIVYELDVETDRLLVWIAGPGDGDEPRRVDFRFTRVTEEPAPVAIADPIAAVEALTAAFNDHDVDAMLALVSDEVEWLSVNGATVGVEAAGKQTLSEGMAGYFDSCPSCRSALEQLMPAGSRVCAFERASWESADGPDSQHSLAVYELQDGRVRRVYYFPAEP